MGFDGNSTWLDQDSTYFKGNVDFYYNLYFYFYAMPFVLGDNGILLEDAKSISFQNKDYKGIKVSYEANVGSSPDDNYILYYDILKTKSTYRTGISSGVGDLLSIRLRRGELDNDLDLDEDRDRLLK